MKTEATDGYSAVQVGYNQSNVPGKVNKPELGHLAKSGAPPLRTLQEFRVRARAVCHATAPAAHAAARPPRARAQLRVARVARFSGLRAAFLLLRSRRPCDALRAWLFGQTRCVALTRRSSRAPRS